MLMNVHVNWALVLLAFVCEYIDSTLGMGYGTTLTPLLLLLGFGTTQTVPSVLLSEFVTGILAGVMHHGLGNVRFVRGSRALKVTAVLAACSVVGTLAAVYVAVNVPSWAVKVYIGVLVLAIGIYILATLGKTFRFAWPKVVGLGLLAAFNKGISGGGYGPLVCGGQVVSGVEEKAAISITSLAEGVVCLVGVLMYLVTGNGGVDWGLAPSLVLGATLSVPLAAVTVKRVPLRQMRGAIGVGVTALGLYTLSRVVVW
jgi:uncharacterized membrane protein YfcA